MKINEVRIKRIKKLRDYESLELGFTVNLEDDPAGPAVERITAFLDWQINLPDWKKTCDRKQAELEAIQAKNGTKTPADVETARVLYDWITNFNRRSAEMDEVGKTL
jgi:hypothetical protein